MNKKNTIVLVLRSGGDFNFHDAQLLMKHIRQYWVDKDSLEIICLRDRTTRIFNLNGMQLIPLQNHWKGWWSKMNLFSPEMEQYRPFLYMDLDTAVIGDLTGVLPPEGNEQHFITLEDFYQKNRMASGLMWIPSDHIKIKRIWDEWIKAPGEHQKRFRGDQEFIRNVTGADVFWQDITNKVSSFKPKSGKLKTVPEGVSIICFHGKPRIWEAAKKYKWVKEYVND